MNEGKVCTRCGKWKPADEFSPHPLGRLGRATRCKRCASELQLERSYAVGNRCVDCGKLIGHRARRCTPCARRERFSRPRPSALERLWSRVIVAGDGACWAWRGLTRCGYAQFRLDHQQQVTVHRFLWEQEHGTLPNGTELHHTCGNRWCVNIAHLAPLDSVSHRKLHARLRREENAA